MIDEPFVCEVCHAEVAPLKVSSRDHCPHCLYSKHVDNNPGDRQCGCRGLLEPVGLEKHKDSYKIVYQCKTCGAVRKNRIAKDDNTDKLIALSSMPING